MRQFFVEMTDTYGGEANFSWVTRHLVTASTMRGAVWKVSRDSGLNWRKVGDYGDACRYDSHSGATCLFISETAGHESEKFSNVKTL